MMTNDKPLTRNYDSDKEKKKLTATFAIKKLDSDLQRIPAEEIAFHNKVKLSVIIDSLLCVF